VAIPTGSFDWNNIPHRLLAIQASEFLGFSKATLDCDVSIFNVRHLAPDFNPRESKEDDQFSFDLSSDLIRRSYLCLEFPGMVMDGGPYVTFDLPAYARSARANLGCQKH
jgi:hypothetical protein